MISRIDKMDWLDLTREKPIEDVDQFMDYVSRWPLFAHMASACICMGLSAAYHLFFVYSPSICKWLAKLDYAGIAILIGGSSMPPINYLFACGPAVGKIK